MFERGYFCSIPQLSSQCLFKFQTFFLVNKSFLTRRLFRGFCFSEYRAFCCQCSWTCVKELVELKQHNPFFKWVCMKHKW